MPGGSLDCSPSGPLVNFVQSFGFNILCVEFEYEEDAWFVLFEAFY